MEIEEEIYITKISYIEPIFEGGLQVDFLFFWSLIIHPFPKVAVQLYLIYMMTTKVDKSHLYGVCYNLFTRTEAFLISKILLMTRGTHGNLK